MNRKEANKKWPKRNGWYYFNENNHEYKLASVTNILNIMSSRALIGWAAKESCKIALDDPTLNEKEVLSKFYSISGDAAKRGTGVHNIFQKLIQGVDEDYPEIYKPYVEPIKEFIKEYKPKHIDGERIVKSLKHGYAGTCDEIIETNNKVWLLDLKTTKSGVVYDTHKLQLEAYRMALAEENIKIDRCCVLLVSGDNTFKLIETKAPFEVFLAAKQIWEWQNGNND